MQKLEVFDFNFDDEFLEEEFHKFFNVNGLLPLFTKEHKVKPIKVSWADARSILNRGSWARQLQEFSNYVSMAVNNQNYTNMMTKILYDAGTFVNMMARIKKLMQSFMEMSDEKIHNMWNAVKYGHIIG